MDADLQRFEEELARLSPGSLPEGLIARMEAAMENWDEGETAEPESKVVPFPPRENEGGAERGRGHGSLWAAAAGVAILGAVAGLLLTSQTKNNPTTAANELGSGSAITPELAAVSFSPQSAKRKILQASDGGIVVLDGARPVRLMRYDYVDRVEFRNNDGHEVHVERPAVDYVLIPVATD